MADARTADLIAAKSALVAADQARVVAEQQRDEALARVEAMGDGNHSPTAASNEVKPRSLDSLQREMRGGYR